VGVGVNDGGDAVTKESYLRRLQKDPWALLVDEQLPPDDWLAAAWEIENVRDAFTYEMARTVSKMGELFYDDDYLKALGRALPLERQLQLFTHIRDGSPHREDEFRGRFEECLPKCLTCLPKPLTRAEVMKRLRLDEEAARHLLDGERYQGP
jgi:hypothetical protein